MDRKEWGDFAEYLPSPEELFHGDDWERAKRQEKGNQGAAEQEAAKQCKKKEEVNPEEVDNVQGQVLIEEPASKRKKTKNFSTKFVIVLLLLALIITNLISFRIHLFCMMSESMGNALPKGSLIVSCQAPADKLGTGDIITYKNQEGLLITQEIVRITENDKGSGCYTFHTKGRANSSEDEEEVRYGMIEGKALFYIPYIGKPFVK